jgi:trans-2-enoyl-CoA reductase
MAKKSKSRAAPANFKFVLEVGCASGFGLSSFLSMPFPFELRTLFQVQGTSSQQQHP